jgi:hypothetical protein
VVACFASCHDVIEWLARSYIMSATVSSRQAADAYIVVGLAGFLKSLEHSTAPPAEATESTISALELH